MEIRPVEAKLFHADRRTDRHDEANCRFPQFCESTEKETYSINISFFVKKGLIKHFPASQII
jgi:hypothetical protein